MAKTTPRAIRFTDQELLELNQLGEALFANDSDVVRYSLTVLRLILDGKLESSLSFNKRLPADLNLEAINLPNERQGTTIRIGRQPGADSTADWRFLYEIKYGTADSDAGADVGVMRLRGQTPKAEDDDAEGTPKT